MTSPLRPPARGPVLYLDEAFGEGLAVVAGIVLDVAEVIEFRRAWRTAWRRLHHAAPPDEPHFSALDEAARRALLGALPPARWAGGVVCFGDLARALRTPETTAAAVADCAMLALGEDGRPAWRADRPARAGRIAAVVMDSRFRGGTGRRFEEAVRAQLVAEPRLAGLSFAQRAGVGEPGVQCADAVAGLLRRLAEGRAVGLAAAFGTALAVQLRE